MLQPRSKRSKYIAFILFDSVATLLSFNLAYVIFDFLGWQPLNQKELYTSIGIIVLLSAFAHLSVGLYEIKIRESIRQVFRRATLSMGLVFLAYQLIVGIMSVPVHNLTVVVALLASVILQTFWRHRAIYSGSLYMAKRKVVFVGAGDRAAFITNRMRRDVDRKVFSGWVFLQVVDINEDVSKDECVMSIKDTGGDPFAVLPSLAPDVVVLANGRKEKISVDVLLELKMSGVEVVELEDFIESELGQIAVEEMRPEWLLVSKGFNFSRFAFEKVNYLFNAFLAVVVLLLTFPLMIAAIVAIYFDDGRKDKAGFLYRQIRVGINGRNFEIIKFRSMGKSAEKNGAQWAVKNDARVTRVGHYLRKYRIDELPQLFNVLKGEMCFVGPRPERPEFVDELSKEIPFFHYRHAVKPGLTGWAQISYPYGACTKDSFEKLKFDLYYIKHRSFLLDLFVLLRTVEIVLFGKGR
jgi:sugar transferase (PEP-CTERM system associated)